MRGEIVVFQLSVSQYKVKMCPKYVIIIKELKKLLGFS